LANNTVNQLANNTVNQLANKNKWVNLNVFCFLENHRQWLIRAIGEVNVVNLGSTWECSIVEPPEFSFLGFVQTNRFIYWQRVIHFHYTGREP
jgi:hypothetical protein